MREIKFRGARTDNGEWVFGDLIHGVKDKNGKLFILPESINQPGCHPLDGFEVIPGSVGQFTGAKDVKGTEIYEGDILCPTPTGAPFTVFRHVVFHDGEFYATRDNVLDIHIYYRNFHKCIVHENKYYIPNHGEKHIHP